MELRETMVILIHLSTYNFITSEQQQALLTAISHLETLQKVKVAGGVEKLEPIQVDIGVGTLESQYENGFNDALVLKDAELAGRLEGILSIVDEVKKEITEEILSRQQYPNIGKKGCLKRIIRIEATIQELFLGKKEE